jgi:hypothetical protein
MTLIAKLKKNLKRNDCLSQEELDLLHDIGYDDLVVLREKAGEWAKINTNSFIGNECKAAAYKNKL